MPSPPIVLPANAPPELVENAWHNAYQNQISQPVDIRFEHVGALVESTRVASEFKTSGKLHVGWNHNGMTDVIPMVTDIGWKKVNSNPKE